MICFMFGRDGTVVGCGGGLQEGSRGHSRFIVLVAGLCLLSGLQVIGLEV